MFFLKKNCGSRRASQFEFTSVDFTTSTSHLMTEMMLQTTEPREAGYQYCSRFVGKMKKEKKCEEKRALYAACIRGCSQI